MKNTEKTAQDVKGFILDLVKVQAVRLGGGIEETLNDETSLVESGLFDSFSFMALLAEVENKFCVELDLSQHEPEYFTRLNGLSLITARLIADVSESK